MKWELSRKLFLFCLPPQEKCNLGAVDNPSHGIQSYNSFSTIYIFHYNFIRNQILPPSGRDGQVLFSVCGTDIKACLKLNHIVEYILQNLNIFNIFATMLKIYQQISIASLHAFSPYELGIKDESRIWNFINLSLCFVPKNHHVYMSIKRRKYPPYQ